MKSKKKSILLLVAVVFISVFSLFNTAKVYASIQIEGRKLPTSTPCPPWVGGQQQTCEEGGTACIQISC